MKPDEEIIVKKAAKEIKDGMLVNLGIGMPTYIPAVLDDSVDVVLHSENGFVGVGAPLKDGTPDNDVIDAGGRACMLVKGAACFDSSMSFAIIRGGNLDIAFLGAFEVAVNGDLANWMIPGKLTPGMGGGMELAQKAKRVVVISRHSDKHGNPKLKESCSLPLTGAACVDTLITELAVFRMKNGKLVLTCVHPSTSVEEVLKPFTFDIEVADKLEAW